jgi:hypothetical protein
VVFDSDNVEMPSRRKLDRKVENMKYVRPMAACGSENFLKKNASM